MKTSPRSQKLASLVQTHLSTIVMQNTTPNQVGFVTITAVEVSGDLSLADIYVSFIKAPSDALKYLQNKSKFFSHQLLSKLQLSQPLMLRFKIDKSVEKTQKLFQK